MPAGTLNMGSQNEFTPDANGWIVFYPKEAISSQTWWSKLSTDGSTGKTWAVPAGTTAPFKGANNDDKHGYFTLQTGSESKKTHAIRFTGAEKASFLVDYNSSDRRAVVALYSLNGNNQVLVESKTGSSSGILELLFGNLSTSTTYIAYIYGTDGSKNSTLYEVALKAPTTPTLTGAWKIGGNTVTEANVVQGASAPTMPTFTVGATSGTPTAADNYSVAYALVDGSTAGIFTFTDGVPTAISTSTSGEATVRATLTTKDASKFKAPTTNTFDYTVTVSAASAPTSIEISGANSAARGADAITLTADVTGGVPTPTIEWFKCDDALKTNPVSQGVASTSNTTLNVATTTVGTYYYYAVASNSQGNVASNVKTITIVPKAPTITASASFVDNKDITITKADGESGDATIKYSTDNGESWSDYSAALNVTETTTVKAKVVQSTLESEVVSATYTKVTPHTWATVSAATTWDWEGNKSSLTTITIPENGSTSYGISRSSEDINLADFDGQVYSDNAGFPVSFKADALLASKFQNPSSNSGYFMGTSLKFQTTVPGIITVDFSNTGSSDRPYRYLYVNGEQTTFKSKTSASTTNATNIQVPAGTVTIKGVMDPESSDSKAGTDQYLRIYKITFTPTVPVTVSNLGYATFASDKALDFTDKTIKAYKATVTGTTVDFTQVNVVPANTGVLLYAAGGATVNVPVATAAAATAAADNFTGNKLVRGTGAPLTYGNGAEYYILSNESAGIGFYKANGNVVSENKAYLDLTGTNAKSFALPGGETDGIRSIENGKLRIENSNYYNLAGQRVGKDYKGIVIVNGKKMLNK